MTLAVPSSVLFLDSALSGLFPIIDVDRTVSSRLFYADMFEKIILKLDARGHHCVPWGLSSYDPPKTWVGHPDAVTYSGAPPRELLTP